MLLREQSAQAAATASAGWRHQDGIDDDATSPLRSKTFWMGPKRFEPDATMSSIRSLARQLGLSITTVSRALDGYSDVAPATRQRVRALAQSLNYQPNAAARSLRRQKSNAVAVALPSGSGHAGLSGLFNVLLDTGSALSSAGFDLLMLPTSSPEAELVSLQRLVEARRVDAVILVRTRIRDRRVALLQAGGVPFITHGRTRAAKPHGFIDGDGEQGFYDATINLVELGHRRIAHLAGPADFMFARFRQIGWQKGMKAAGLASDLVYEVLAPSEAEGRSGARRLLALKARPTALLCATDMIAIGAMAAARDLGLVPGRDIAIVGHDGLSVGAFSDPPLSTMEIAAANVGDLMADLMLKRIGGADPRDVQLVLPIRQVPRGTHGPPRASQG